MTTIGNNFKFYLNGKKVTEQEIRDCKENMSVTINGLSVFYSFSPKIEKPFNLYKSPKRPFKFVYNRPKPMDIKPYEFFSVSLYVTYGIDNVKLAKKIYNDGRKDNLTLEYILENYSYFLTAKDYTNIEIWKKEKEAKNSAKKLKEDLEKLKGKVIFKKVSKGIYAYVETYLPVVDYEQKVDNRMRLAEKFKQAALNKIYPDGVPVVTSKVIASCYTSADEMEKIKEELYPDFIKKCLIVKGFDPSEGSWDYSTPISTEKDKTEEIKDDVITNINRVDKELIDIWNQPINFNSMFRDPKKFVLLDLSKRAEKTLNVDLIMADTLVKLGEKTIKSDTGKITELGDKIVIKFPAGKYKKEKLIFTTLEKELTSEKQQGHLSTRHKKPEKMYLDEFLGNIAEKEITANYHQVETDKEQQIGDITISSYTQYPMTPDESYYILNLKLHEELKDSILPQKEIKTGVKDSQTTPKAPIFTYCKQMRNAIEQLAFRSEYGHQRYLKFDEDYQNFSRVPNGDEEYGNAQFRHALGIGNDTELEHYVASAWDAVARLEIYLRNKTK